MNQVTKNALAFVKKQWWSNYLREKQVVFWITMTWFGACNFTKKESLAHVFSCEFCEISKNAFSDRTPLVAAFEPRYDQSHKKPIWTTTSSIELILFVFDWYCTLSTIKLARVLFSMISLLSGWELLRALIR